MLRGAVDGWDFKNYVLETMFYRYISENITDYINKGEYEDFITSKQHHWHQSNPRKGAYRFKAQPGLYNSCTGVNVSDADAIFPC